MSRFAWYLCLTSESCPACVSRDLLKVPGMHKCHVMVAAVSDTDTLVNAAFTAVTNDCSKQREIVNFSTVNPWFVVQDAMLVFAHAAVYHHD